MDVLRQFKDYDDKTEFLILGSRRQLLKINLCSIRFNSIDIKPISVALNSRKHNLDSNTALNSGKHNLDSSTALNSCKHNLD